MKLLTRPSWSGLPIYQCEYRTGNPGLRLPVSVLLYWPADGMSLEVDAEFSGHAIYQARAGRFDLLPEDAFVAVLRAEQVVHPLVIAVPSFWVAALVLERDHEASLRYAWVQFSDRRVERLVRGLQQHRVCNEPLGEHYTQALSTILVDCLLAHDQGRAPDAPSDGGILRPVVRRMVEELIEERLDAPPDVGSLAALTGQGALRFLRAFKATLGVTLHQYVMRRRIERAKQMLGSATRPLTSLALELGFASHSHFTAAFRAHTGVTPSAYRGVRHTRTQRCGTSETVPVK